MQAQPNTLAGADTAHQSLAQILAQDPSMHNFSKATGLEGLAKELEGERSFVCDLDLYGVQGCADLRNEMMEHHFAAELIALGLAIFAAVIVGSLAVAFVHLATKMAAPLGKHRIYAIFPRPGEARRHLKEPIT